MVTSLHLNIEECVLTPTKNEQSGLVIFLHLNIQELVPTTIISLNAQYRGIYRRTIESVLRDCIFEAKCYLKVHNAHLVLPISWKVITGIQI